MRIIKTKDYNEMSDKATQILIREISKKPNSVIGFATGHTPLGFYKNLIKEYKKGKVNFSKTISFNLDEFYPIKKTNKKSYYYYMHKNLFNHVNIKKSNINLLNGETKSPGKECKNYENKIKKHRINIQILGVGVNGHIAYNQPGSKINSKTRLVKLKDKRALSMGIKTILSAKKIILLASGKKKAKAIKQLVKGKISEEFPVTYLKKHKNLIVIADKEACSLL